MREALMSVSEFIARRFKLELGRRTKLTPEQAKTLQNATEDVAKLPSLMRLRPEIRARGWKPRTEPQKKFRPTGNGAIHFKNLEDTKFYKKVWWDNSAYTETT